MSPSDAFRAAMGDGTSGLLAAGDGDWESALERLVLGHEVRDSMARTARRDVYRRYSPLVQDGGLLAICDEISERGPCHEGPAPSPIPMEAGGGSCVALEPAAAAYDAYQLDAESGGPLVPLGGRAVVRLPRRRPVPRRRDGHTCVRRNRTRCCSRCSTTPARCAASASSPPPSSSINPSSPVELQAPVEDSAGRTFVLRATGARGAPATRSALFHAPAGRGLRVGGEIWAGR
jgi:hypothetical protein